MVTERFDRFKQLLNELLSQRAAEAVYYLDDETEENFLEALSDCRQDMSPEDELKVGKLLRERRVTVCITREKRIAGVISREPIAPWWFPVRQAKSK